MFRHMSQEDVRILYVRPEVWDSIPWNKKRQAKTSEFFSKVLIGTSLRGLALQSPVHTSANHRCSDRRSRARKRIRLFIAHGITPSRMLLTE